MTTKLIIQNDATSNGDVIVRAALASYVVAGETVPDTRHLRVFPGESVTLGITDYSLVSIHEEWPTTKPPAKE